MNRMIRIFFAVMMLALNVVNLGFAETEEIPQEGEIIVNNEGYRLTEVLFIPWGDGENEIAIGTEEEHKRGPQNFIVDNEGNIYIDDPGKYRGYGTGRIIKYSQQEGKLSYLTGINYIYGVLDNGNIIDGRGEVYNSKGEPLYKFRIPLTESSIKKIIQCNNEIYVYSEGYNTLIISDEEDKWGYRLAYYKEKKKTKYYERNKGYPSKFFDRDYLVSESTGVVKIEHLDKNGKERKKINVMKEKEKKLSKYQIGTNPLIIGDDKQGNIYCILGFSIPSPYYPKKGFPAIQKYNEKGEILLILRYFTNWTGIDMPNLTFEVDVQGNIYQLYTLKDGIRIVKWEK